LTCGSESAVFLVVRGEIVRHAALDGLMVRRSALSAARPA
jgi:hypothetical protein